ncbi:hypothetical protein GTS_54120 [Gandjariella thermophila]|uniref:Uncharacterized protein n=1 Tax=Gandjariella thermophila TaxID=1931992 RepID=A0A4D4JHM1_9PSEU|nr:hypothetical protein GTS_54120 [Gandjariella thermophila]
MSPNTTPSAPTTNARRTVSCAPRPWPTDDPDADLSDVVTCCRLVTAILLSAGGYGTGCPAHLAGQYRPVRSPRHARGRTAIKIDVGRLHPRTVGVERSRLR